MDANVKSWFTACTLLTGLCLGCSELTVPDNAASNKEKTAGAGNTSAASAPVAGGKEAKAGVGIQGQGYGDDAITGPVTAQIRAKFMAEQTVAFSLVTHALDLYKAANDGKGPKSHDEFMKVIVEANAIKLPKLPDGQRYQYDVKTEKLMVVEGS